MKLFALREKELGRYVTRGPGDSEGVWPVRVWPMRVWLVINLLKKEIYKIAIISNVIESIIE